LRIDPEYQSDVLSKNRSPVYASLEWLKEAHAIDDSDVVAFERVKKVRNELAHALIDALFQGLPADFAERFGEMISLLDKFERWWIVNVEIPIDSDLDNVEIDEAKVIPGPVMGLRLLVDIALGSEEESKRYLDELRSELAAAESAESAIGFGRRLQRRDIPSCLEHLEQPKQVAKL
jgi:hypothetical protein